MGFRFRFNKTNPVNEWITIYGYGSIPIDTIFSGLFTSINPSYFDVNYRGTRVLTHPHILDGFFPGLMLIYVDWRFLPWCRFGLECSYKCPPQKKQAEKSSDSACSSGGRGAGRIFKSQQPRQAAEHLSWGAKTLRFMVSGHNSCLNLSLQDAKLIWYRYINLIYLNIL